jgi:hypothetical protein
MVGVHGHFKTFISCNCLNCVHVSDNVSHQQTKG